MVEKVKPVISGATPLDFLQAVYMNSELPLNTRLRAAMAAAPFCHPKLAVIATTTSEDLVDRLERARAESAKVINSRPLVIEAKPVEVPLDPPPDPPDHSRPFASLGPKSRFTSR